MITTRGFGRSIMTGAVHQTWALLRFRREEFRGSARRRLDGALIATALALPTLPLVTAALRPQPTVVLTIAALLPALWMLFAVSTMISMLLNGPGRTLISRAEAQAFLVTPGADHLCALLLSPLNTSWTLQVLALIAFTGMVTGISQGLFFSLAITWAFIIACTTTAQTLGWFTAGLVTYRHGQNARRITIAALVLGAAWLARSPLLPVITDNLPTRRFIFHIVAASGQAPSGQSWTEVALLLCWSLALTFVGAVAAGWWHRRPERSERHHDLVRARRRADPTTELAADLSIDRHSIWRSAPLRRGAFVLAGLPAVGGILAPMPWPLLDLLPGMVVSGLALLFGVNLWALDGTGALWRASLPARPTLALVARSRVLLELAAAGCLLTLTPAVVMATGTAGPAEVTALIGATITAMAFVTGRCTWWSVSHPYTAPLQETRDQPAPPAAMAGYAARMAVSTTLWGLGFSLAARIESVPMALALTTAALLLAVYDMTRAFSLWTDDGHRLAVLAVVTGQSGTLAFEVLSGKPSVPQRWHRVT